MRGDDLKSTFRPGNYRELLGQPGHTFCQLIPVERFLLTSAPFVNHFEQSKACNNFNRGTLPTVSGKLIHFQEVKLILRGLYIILFTFRLPIVSAQTERIPLALIITDASVIEETIINQQSYIDSLFVEKKLRQQLLDFNRDGYLAASIDSITYKEDRIVAYCHKGLKYYWVKVVFDSVDPSILRKANIGTKKYHNRLVDPDRLVKD